jgi:hypothetical protein
MHNDIDSLIREIDESTGFEMFSWRNSRSYARAFKEELQKVLDEYPGSSIAIEGDLDGTLGWTLYMLYEPEVYYHSGMIYFDLNTVHVIYPVSKGTFFSQDPLRNGEDEFALGDFDSFRECLEKFRKRDF